MTTDESYKIALDEMCKRVDVDPKNVDFHAPFWYQDHTWTEKEQQDYANWLAEQIITDNEFRKAFTTLQYRPSKKKRLKVANYFVSFFGWKIKEEK